ncbi:MAG: hypothetical protein KDC18_18030 [Alphaproteobacteria bacterium]|nr:hypothetical protein [Alphaproteobacteria bacterium]MCB9928867.1 hypothetical protein [Alphaproteobacteria bacterium]
MFSSAEEAWLWAVQGMRCRLAGAHVLPGLARAERPCEASDVLNWATRLRRERRLTADELGVLLLYGRHAVPPHALGAKHRPAVPVWDKALAVLESLLVQKGVVAAGAEGGIHG